ncbi:hypothetical protein P154DRAFT_587731 [Amniculicola lignicola CBS 123094]|uniref:Uncharacterized protein n=1 Tax=Amniculicola lignicola CBS 123094 TaxID=1392246 RepID=A0A6A5VWR4_9PLEO|nr:hypothetical protein P154DRAFT_587731 [Amniculicola lignicola CBS 123094]
MHIPTVVAFAYIFLTSTSAATIPIRNDPHGSGQRHPLAIRGSNSLSDGIETPRYFQRRAVKYENNNGNQPTCCPQKGKGKGEKRECRGNKIQDPNNECLCKRCGKGERPDPLRTKCIDKEKRYQDWQQKKGQSDQSAKQTQVQRKKNRAGKCVVLGALAMGGEAAAPYLENFFDEKFLKSENMLELFGDTKLVGNDDNMYDDPAFTESYVNAGNGGQPAKAKRQEESTLEDDEIIYDEEWKEFMENHSPENTEYEDQVFDPEPEEGAIIDNGFKARRVDMNDPVDKTTELEEELPITSPEDLQARGIGNLLQKMDYNEPVPSHEPSTEKPGNPLPSPTVNPPPKLKPDSVKVSKTPSKKSKQEQKDGAGKIRDANKDRFRDCLMGKKVVQREEMSEIIGKR